MRVSLMSDVIIADFFCHKGAKAQRNTKGFLRVPLCFRDFAAKIPE
jgi:hypothetical protein